MAAAAVQRPGAPPPPAQRYQGVQKESAGYRLLSAMGWREGEGLGASKQGIKSHIKVKKKFENWGVGAVEAAQHAQNWTNGMLDFHRVLSNLSEVVSEHAAANKKKRRKAGSSGSGSGSEEGAAAGDAASSSSSEDEAEEQPQAKAKGKGKAGKKRKAAADGSAAAAAEQQAEEEEEAAAPKRVKAATHIGRFKKREAAKMVKAYSDHDLAAILGGDPFAAAAAAVPEVRAVQRQQPEASSSGYDSDSEPSDSEEAGSKRRQAQQAAADAKGEAGKRASRGKAAAAAAGERAQDAQQTQQQAAQQPERPPMIVVRRPMPAACRPPAPPTPKEGRDPGWWQLCFHKAAGPGGVGAQAAAQAGSNGAGITIHGFSEQDQTNLYNLAHDKATQGRVGLGRSSMPKKVAGTRWAGKKTRIQDSDEEGSDGELSAEEAVPLFNRQEGHEVGPAPAGVELEREEGLVIILPASKRHLLDALPDCGPAQQQQQAAAAAAEQQQQAGQADGKPGGKKQKKGKQAKAAAAAEQPDPSAAAAGGDAVGGIRWKKAVGAALKASSKGRLKLSKLHKAIAKEAGLPKAQRPAALDALTAFLQQSSKFELADGVVQPAAAS